MGRVIKRESIVEETGRVALPRRKLKTVTRDDTSWTEMEGLTWEEAKAIAQVGCDLAGAGRLEEARVIFEGLLEGNPRDSAALSALGTVYQKLGRTQDALAAYDAAIAIDPANPVALGNRGEMKLRAGDRAGFSDLARAVQADPHGETHAARRAKSLIREITTQTVKHLQVKK